MTTQTTAPKPCRARIVRVQNGPAMRTTQFVCSCGAASPEAANADVAIIAKRSHLMEVGLADRRGAE
jgi:hypothetical protein